MRHRAPWTFWMTVLLSLCMWTGCEGEDSSTPAPSYQAEIAPLLEANCTSCHREGGGAPFALDTPESAALHAEASRNAIEAGRMPPWLPDPDCRHFPDERILSPEDKEVFGRWVDGGRPLDVEPEGQKADGDQGVPARPFITTHTTQPVEAYIPDATLADDYRCFPLDLEFDEELFIRGSEVFPGSMSLVHHVLIFSVAPDKVATMEELDAADDGPGYRCFGGPQTGVPHPVGAWVPGMPPTVLDADVGIRLPKDSRLVMQVHYNMLVGEPEPDLTRWELELSDEKPDWLLDSRPFAHLDIQIPAGDASSVQERLFVNETEETWVISAMAPHMHLLGKRIRVDHVPADGDEVCMIDIRAWDFNWQQTYRLPTEEWIQVAPGDGVRLTCEYDNSQGNQAWIDGAQVAPRDVTWGDGTLDEMCLVYLTSVTAYTDTQPMCEAYGDCYTTCMDSEEGAGFGCMTSCMGEDRDCATCILPGVFLGGGCINDPCKEQLEASQECLQSCASGQIGSGEDFEACMQASCPEEHIALDACAAPLIDAGECDEAFTTCGTKL